MTAKNELDNIWSELEADCLKKKDFRDAVIVTGKGPAPCRIMVVGEAPGRDETRLKTPFVGKAGKFFISILEEALGLKRSEIYISNVIKIWPKIDTKRLKTRKPLKEEEAFFIPYLKREISIVKPKVILAVGKTAFSALAPEEEFTPGKWVHKGNLRIMPIYHPSYILRRQKSLEESTEKLKEALREVKAEL